MRPYKISQLSTGFVLTVAVLSVLLATYMWFEMKGISAAVQQREVKAAHEEISQALGALEKHIVTTANGLATWDETKQQLVFDEYYQLWRDTRVRNAGKVPESTDAVALYDKSGHILYEHGFMPTDIPGQVPEFRFATHAGHEYLFYFYPVYADPAQQVLLGYGGLKFDLVKELHELQSYRYADIDTLKVDLNSGLSGDLASMIGHIHFSLRQNQYLPLFYAVFQNSLIRLEVFVVAIMLIAAYLLHRIMVRPLYAIIGEIDALQNASDSLAERLSSRAPLPVLELENMRRSFNDYQSRLAELHYDLEQSNRDFYDQARHDALTGIYNRRAFEEDWLSMTEAAATPGLALMLLDCDHFKAINDSYGHDVGDRVIKVVAQTLQQVMRNEDRLYRLGGDEFATFITAADVEEVEHIAERCQEQLLLQDFSQYGMSERVTLSVGIAYRDPPEMGLSQLLKYADLAMYAAKRPGERNIVFYDAELDNLAAIVANTTVNAVFRALGDTSMLEMHYQPIVSLPGREPSYTEALVRIRHNAALLRPDAIFPVVHQRRLDVEFDLAVIQAVGRDIQHKHPGTDAGVSINLSAPGVMNNKVIDALIALRTREQGCHIVVEITETALITQMETATGNIQRLRDAGCLVALDDFGSGYSSLRYLTTMPVDLVKFDMSMIGLLLHEDPRQRRITEEIAALVSSAGYRIVAEGVENEAILQRVEAVGFHYAQGFYFPDLAGAERR